MINEGQVRTAIAVLRAFAAGEIQAPDELLCDLVDAAVDALGAPGVTYITCEIDDDDPPTIASA